DESVGRQDDFVARLDSQRVEAGKERAGAVGGGETRPRAGQPRVVLFEARHIFPVAPIPLAAAHRVENGPLLGLVEDRPGGGQAWMCVAPAEKRRALGGGVGGERSASERRGGQESSTCRIHRSPFVLRTI